MRAHVVSWVTGNHHASAWSAGGEPAQTPQVILLAAFSRPLSRYLPLLDRPPVLRLWCADETCSTQWTICVPCLHLLPLCREDAWKGRCAGREHAPSASSLAGRVSS